jgi:hypothetical protein
MLEGIVSFSKLFRLWGAKNQDLRFNSDFNTLDAWFLILFLWILDCGWETNTERPEISEANYFRYF